MKDAPADQVASVNAFNGRGEGEDGTHRTDEHSSLRAPSANPPPTVATKIKKALMVQQRGEMQIQTRAGMQKQS